MIPMAIWPHGHTARVAFGVACSYSIGVCENGAAIRAVKAEKACVFALYN
jgi:hypothetical protein